jgi:hypothetical protein
MIGCRARQRQAGGHQSFEGRPVFVCRPMRPPVPPHYAHTPTSATNVTTLPPHSHQCHQCSALRPHCLRTVRRVRPHCLRTVRRVRPHSSALCVFGSDSAINPFPLTAPAQHDRQVRHQRPSQTQCRARQRRSGDIVVATYLGVLHCAHGKARARTPPFHSPS